MRLRYLTGSLVLAITLVLTGAVGRAQQAPAGAQAAGQTPLAIVWPSPPLADGPITLDTAVQQIRLIVTKGLAQPWSMAFLPDGAILVTERPGRLRIVRNGALDPNPIAGVPQVYTQRLSGLLDLALHPRFGDNQLVYFTYHKPPDNAGNPANTRGIVTLARGRWNGTALVDVRDVFSAGPGGASRIVFGRDGTLYMTVGTGDPPDAARAQDPASLAGKVLRLTDDGSVPPDNPFVGRAGYRPEIYTMGHRNMLGLMVHPETGAVWENENGPNGGDEINVLQPGRNYGWPIVSYGRFYPGPRVAEVPWREGMEQPLVFWVPSIAISGMTAYTGDRFPNWKNNVFVGGMRQGEVPRSGHLERIQFNEKGEELRREAMLRELQQRIRDVRQGPDGLLYLLTAEDAGALIRMEPAAQPSTR